jgi:hypothetical protein
LPFPAGNPTLMLIAPDADDTIEPLCSIMGILLIMSLKSAFSSHSSSGLDGEGRDDYDGITDKQ